MKRVYLAQMSLHLPGSTHVYFPYSIGVLWSYALQNPRIKDNFELGELFFLKEPIDQLLEKVESPDVFALSSYVWNSAYNEAVAAAVKKRWPDCVVILGGPDVPNLDDGYFRSNPSVDYLVHQEGELSFSGLLLNMIDGASSEGVPGLSINRDGERLYTGPSQRIRDLSTIPSPYTSGLFDKIYDEYKNDPRYELNGVIETNRGCPFSCTFCDWGGVTFSKVSCFPLERLRDEIDWMGKRGITYLHTTDANFGIFKDRDDEIADILIETKSTYGYPKVFDTSWTKNTTPRTVSLARKLFESGILRSFVASLQSMNATVLENIKRTNMTGDRLDEIIALASQNGITVLTEMIVGLPGETYETWQDGVCELLNKGMMVETYPIVVLKNSEMNDPRYKEKFSIETKTIKSQYSDHVDEWSDVIVSTEHIDRAAMERVWLWTWITYMFQSYGFSKLDAEYLRKRHGIPTKLYYEHLLETFLSDASTVFHPHLAKWRSHAENLEYHHFVPGFIFKDVVTDIGINNRDRFFADLQRAAAKLLPAPDPYLKDVFALQKHIQTSPANPFETEVICSANLYEYLASDAPLKHEPTHYLVRQMKIDDHYGDWFDFVNASRKNGAWKASLQKRCQKL